MGTRLDLRRTGRGSTAATLFAATVTPEGITAPSLCALVPLRRGTRLRYEGNKYEISTPLAVGMHRPRGGLFLKRVT